MNHFEFKKKYILSLYQTPWKFIDSPSILKAVPDFQITNNNPILSLGKVINIPHGELTFNISQTIIGSNGVVLNLSPGELLFGYSNPRLRVGHGILLNLTTLLYNMNFFYKKIIGSIGRAKTTSASPTQLISYNTIPILKGTSEFITIASGSLSVVYHSILNNISDAIELPDSSLSGVFVAYATLEAFDSAALSTTWILSTDNIFSTNILVNTGTNLIIPYHQASINYNTIISIYRIIYISYYDDGSLLSDIEDLTLEDFSHAQFAS